MKIKYSSNKSSKWSCDDNRVIHHNGEPIFRAARVHGSVLKPADTDDLAEFIVFLLNEEDATPERGPVIIRGST